MSLQRAEIQRIFTAAVELDAPVQRAAFLDAACGQKLELRAEVESLLAHDVEARSFIERPALATPATLDIPQVTARVGTTIGPYKLLQQIGEGGMGIVWMAEQTEPVQRKVALKVIKPGMDSQQVIARFEAERQALAMMDHVNIARVFDGGSTKQGLPYFVMELVHGVPITKYCDDNHLTLRQRLRLFVPVCQAIQHAHQKGIIHRDIKPTNVMVTLYDGQPVPKVIDFGVAKATEQKLTERTLFTQYGTMVGTFEYMSPEQAEMSALGVDTRSDIYSLGVLLYELLTGSTPLCNKRLKEAAFAEILRMIKEEEPPKPSTRLSSSGAALASISAQRQLEPAKLTRLVRGELDWIVMKALEKDRNRRYETANSMAQDVEHYLRDEPVSACPPSAWYSFRKFARRHKRGLLTASIVTLAVVLTAATSGGLIWRANQELQQSLERQQRSAYFERIALAEREWGANNLSRMEQLLDDCPEKLRGWEWNYLKRLRFGAPAPLRHESAVYCVVFSPDGQYLATATKDGFVRLCGAKTGQELRKWRAHEENATCLQFSPNSRYLASGGWDKVKMWEVQTVLQGEFETPFLQLEDASRFRVWSVTFSPDGRCLATAGGRTADQKGEVKVWDLQTRQATLTFSNFSDSVRCVRFSPDGGQLATSAGEGMVQLWDAKTGQLQHTFRWGAIRCGELAFSPDGRRLAAIAGHLAVHPDQDVKVWDTRTGNEILSLHGHVGGLRAVAFSPDGSRIASAGLDQTVKVWDAVTGQPVLTLRGHTDNLFCVAFSPDGHQLASAGIDRTVRIWDARPVDREPGPEYLTLHGHNGAVTDLAFHPKDERLLATGCTDGMVRVWDFGSNKLLSALPGPSCGNRLRLAYSPDGGRLAVANGDRPAVKVWDIETAKEICTLAEGSSDAVMCSVFSPDGRHVASAGFDFMVRIWDATTAQQIQVLEGHEWPIFDVAFSPDGKQIVSCSGDSTVRVWDWMSGQSSILEPGHATRVVDVAFSRDGKLLASASWDRTVKVWDTATWQLLHNLHDSTEGAVECVAFGPDDRRLAWGSTDGTVKVWDGQGSETQILRGHTSWVQAVAFSQRGEWIASASLDGTVKVWKAPPMPKEPAPEAEGPGKQRVPAEG